MTTAPGRLLDKDATALVVVDLQERLLPAISGERGRPAVAGRHQHGHGRRHASGRS